MSIADEIAIAIKVPGIDKNMMSHPKTKTRKSGKNEIPPPIKRYGEKIIRSKNKIIKTIIFFKSGLKNSFQLIINIL